MNPIIIVGLAILSFMSVKSFSANPIDKDGRNAPQAMEHRNFSSEQASTIEAPPTNQAPTPGGDNTPPVAVIEVPEANLPDVQVANPEDTDLSQNDSGLPSDVDTSDAVIGGGNENTTPVEDNPIIGIPEPEPPRIINDIGGSNDTNFGTPAEDTSNPGTFDSGSAGSNGSTLGSSEPAAPDQGT